MRAVGRVLILVVFVGCLLGVWGCGGGSQHFDPNSVTVTITPAKANVPAGGTLTLQGTVNGECSSCAPSLLFEIQEIMTPGASGTQCNWVTGDSLPAGPCPYGTLEIGLGLTTKAIFHAPSTPGTVHIIAEAFVPQTNSYIPISKTATATLTVQ